MRMLNVVVMMVAATTGACRQDQENTKANPNESAEQSPGAPASARRSTGTPSARAPKEGSEKIEALFVQSTKQLAFDGKTLTLKDPHPTLYFSDARSGSPAT